MKPLKHAAAIEFGMDGFKLAFSSYDCIIPFLLGAFRSN